MCNTVDRLKQIQFSEPQLTFSHHVPVFLLHYPCLAGVSAEVPTQFPYSVSAVAIIYIDGGTTVHG